MSPPANGESTGSDSEQADGSDDPTRVAIACQGGGSHTAFTAGALRELLAEWEASEDAFELAGISGTSGGAFNAVAVWYGLLTGDESTAIELLDSIWADIAATDPFDQWLNSAVRTYSWLDTMGIGLPEVSPYYSPGSEWAQQQLAETLRRYIDFEAIPQLADEETPELVVGAVNIAAGTFETFTNQEVTLDAVLASAAVPRWFEAVEIDGDPHWDGLLSQNPPVTDLLSVPGEQTPEELWVIQINPQARAEMPTTLSEIADRRNELAGNISLNQELRFVQWINDKLAEGSFEHPEYRQVDVKRIELSDYPYATKADRSQGFIEQLTAEGKAAATAFFDGQTAAADGQG